MQSYAIHLLKRNKVQRYDVYHKIFRNAAFKVNRIHQSLITIAWIQLYTNISNNKHDTIPLIPLVEN
ncbi:hypothetical protein LguiA_022508 [Lonicera macranthoides]